MGNKLQTIRPAEIYERLPANKAKQLLFLEWDRQGSARGKTETLVYWKSRFLKPPEKTGQTQKETAEKAQASWSSAPRAEGCAGTHGHNCLPQRMCHCCWRAGRCLTLPAQAPSPHPPQGLAWTYCFPWGVQGSAHRGAAMDATLCPLWKHPPGLGDRSSVGWHSGTPRARRPMPPAAPQNSLLN